MRRGLFLPIFDELADPSLLADLAAEAEQAGWDGVFLWDHVVYRAPIASATDPWIAMAAMATRTERVVVGPMVTPVARRRPHILARQLVALDHLSSGRIVFGAGLGLDASGGELSRFGEELDDRRRATMLDEGLGVLTALLSGARIDHHGEHYTASDVAFLPTPVRGHLPIWVAGRWPNHRPLKRAARFDGVFLIDIQKPKDLPKAIEVIAAERGSTDDFDIVVEITEHETPDRWEQQGATWVLDAFDPFTVTVDAVRRRITKLA